MKRSVNRLLPIFIAGAFVYAGCAKQEVVKKDEPFVPATKPVGSSQVNQGATAAKGPDKTTATPTATSSPSVAQQKSSLNKKATDDLSKAFEKIYFNFDSSTLSDTARQALARDFALLKQNQQFKVRIEGHCDERGSDEYNLALGERRAQEAVRYLKTMGIPADRLSSISYGREKPADPGHDEAAWSKNRRDEFVVSK